MEFSHRGGTRDFSAVFSELHSPVDSDAFGVIRSTRPMCYPGVTAEVYPRATHLSLGISYRARLHTRVRPAPLPDCGAGSSFTSKRGTEGLGKGQLGACLDPRSAASCRCFTCRSRSTASISRIAPRLDRALRRVRLPQVISRSSREIVMTEPLTISSSFPDQDRKSTRLNSSHSQQSRMPSSA